MKLDDWLRQDHSLGERLRVVERLSLAVNEVHDRGETLPALAPSTVEVDSDGGCDVKAARRGSAAAPYLAPERESGDPSSAEADIYAAGAIAWEVLAGRPCGDSPPHLAEARPGLPREVADAVMGCLERSPVWRPKDLAYLAQVAAAQQTSSRSPQPAAARPGPAARTPARSSAGAGAARTPARASQRRPSRSHVPLVFVGLVVVAAAAGSYFWLTRSASGTSSVAALPPPPSAAATPAGPGGRPPVAGGEANPAPAASTPAPAPTRPADVTTPPPAGAGPVPVAPVPTPAATPTPLPAATPPPTPTPAPLRAAPPLAAPTPTPAQAAPPVTAPAQAPAQVAPPVPAATPAPAAVLSTVSPLTIQRARKQALVDLRGTDLRADHKVRVVALREAPHGIRVLRQQWVNAGLIKALLELDPDASTGTFGITVVDAAGEQAPPLSLTIAK